MGDHRVRWLLGLALALAVLRFVIVPWTQQQVERRQQLEVLTQRLDRSAGVVQSADQILAAQSKLAAAREATLAPYPLAADKDRFRLDVQRRLSAIATRGGVTVTLFDWIVDGDAAEAGMAYGRVNVSIAGPLRSVVAVHGALEAEMPYAAVREGSMELGRNSVRGLTDDAVTLALVIDLYYRPEAPAPALAAGAGT